MSIFVTQPFMPPIGEYKALIDEIWERHWLTNHGPVVDALECRLRDYLSTPYLHFVTNGTIAIQIAIKALQLSGEVITTPFSYVATTSSLVWEHCRPVMADIDPSTLNIDPSRIDALVTRNTTGILATHVYGNPCDVLGIEKVASKHNLRVIYDAAHAFGTRLNGQSLYSFGDISTASFHATKLFHTVEGGGVISRSADLHAAIRQLRNFGHTSPTSFDICGINGKNSEFHAAMGICNLKHIDDILSTRKTLCASYDARLGNSVQRPKLHPDCNYNFAYYPILLESESQTLEVLRSLGEREIFPRRYFYPSLSDLPYVSDQTAPISEEVSRRVLCLPLFHSLQEEQLEYVCDSLLRAM